VALIGRASRFGFGFTPARAGAVEPLGRSDGGVKPEGLAYLEAATLIAIGPYDIKVT
jgi:hypothetical protein